jgi:hypothetical protein
MEGVYKEEPLEEVLEIVTQDETEKAKTELSLNRKVLAELLSIIQGEHRKELLKMIGEALNPSSQNKSEEISEKTEKSFQPKSAGEVLANYFYGAGHSSSRTELK